MGFFLAGGYPSHESDDHQAKTKISKYSGGQGEYITQIGFGSGFLVGGGGF